MNRPVKEFNLGSKIKLSLKGKYHDHMIGRVYQDYEEWGDGIYWVLQSAVILKGQYSEQDRLDLLEENALEVVQDGEVVLIGGEEYRVKINGDYSDCAVFSKV